MNNTKALNSIREFHNQIYSYLEADPNKQNFNFITSIPAKNRNDKNGWANFKFHYISIANVIENLNVRIETNIFNDTLSIRPSYAMGMKNADLIIFIDYYQKRLLIADKKINNNNLWLDDKSLRNVSTHVVNNKSKAFYEYNVESLLRNHALFEIYTEDENIRLIHDDFTSYFNGQVMKLNSDVKGLNDYDTLGTDKIVEVQLDAKDRDTVYFGTVNDKVMSNPATLLGIASMCTNFTDLTKDAIYQRLFRALKNGTSAVIPTKNATDAIKDLLNNDGNIELYLSYNDDTKIEKKLNKTDDAEYRKSYRKVSKYSKDHDTPKVSWTDFEKELFYTIKNK